MRKIIIEISGGNVQEIYSTEKENDAVAIYVIDWDNIEAGQLTPIMEYPCIYVGNDSAKKLIDSANDVIKENRKRV